MTGDQRAEIAQQLIARVHNFSDLDQGLRRSRLSRGAISLPTECMSDAILKPVQFGVEVTEFVR